MANGKDIAWKPILLCVGVGLGMFVAGAFLAGPPIHKRRLKKQAEKKKKSGEKETMKKAA